MKLKNLQLISGYSYWNKIELRVSEKYYKVMFMVAFKVEKALV